MKTIENEMLSKASEDLYQVIYINRTVNMAVDFLHSGNPDSNIDAIQGVLRSQEEIIKKLIKTFENL